jgi:Xaa-Pro aminopeptidase
MEISSTTEHRAAYIAYLLEENKLDALFISRPVHIRYLTGFTGSNGLALVTSRNRYLITDSRYEVQVTAEVPDWKLVIAKSGLYDEIKRRNFLRNARHIGIESNYLSYEQYKYNENKFSGKRWKALDVTIEPLLLQKSQSEIDSIKKAIAISEQTFSNVIGMIKPGIPEKEIAAELTYQHRLNGAEGDAFESIVASGARAALPHARPSDKKIKNKELIVIDFGCTFNGYHSDITRTIAVGRPDSEARKCYTIVNEALHRATDAVREGMSCKKLDSIGRRYIQKSGYGKYFNHSLGHGIGLDVHELPRISPYSKERLVAGSTITLEPGIYIPERFGIRIEDDILVTTDRAEILTMLPRELMTV